MTLTVHISFYLVSLFCIHLITAFYEVINGLWVLIVRYRFTVRPINEVSYKWVFVMTLCCSNKEVAWQDCAGSSCVVMLHWYKCRHGAHINR